MLYQFTREESRTKTSKWEEIILPAGYEELDQSKLEEEMD
jgi:hypothetical protein